MCGVVRDLTLMMMYISSSCPDLPKMTLIINLHLSSINFTLFSLKRSTSQNPNPEISVKLLYLFVEFTTIVKLIIPLKVNIDTPIKKSCIHSCSLLRESSLNTKGVAYWRLQHLLMKYYCHEGIVEQIHFL